MSWYLYLFSFSFSPRYFIVSLDFFFDPVVVQEYVVQFPDIREFFHFLLLLIFSFIPLWLEKILGMISIFLNLLRHVLWPSM